MSSSVSSAFSLAQLGWRACFAQQLTLDDLDTLQPVRVGRVHRTAIDILGLENISSLLLTSALLSPKDELRVTTGDWLLVERESHRIHRRLDRFSLIERMAAGIRTRAQLIAANIDTLFIVSSCNDDFNPSRLERYLTLAFEAGVEPVILLTKADRCNDPSLYAEQAQALSNRVQVLTLNALDTCNVAQLSVWLTAGQTVAFVGSSGVGKSTLVNTLSGASIQETGGIREHDSKGRHTTTARDLVPIAGGAWLIDTPGMRELKLGAADAGLDATFTEIATLAAHCRFRDCRHQGDAGCAVRAAIDAGTLDARRLTNYLKLQREVARATQSVHELHAQSQKFGRAHKAIKRAVRNRGKG